MAACSVPLRVWLVLAGLVALDLAWCVVRGFVILDWWPVVTLAALLLAAGTGLRRIGGRWSPVATAAEWFCPWLGGSCAGALLTYLTAAHDGPVYDSAVASADALLGFEWDAWHDFVVAHPWLEWPFAVTYRSLVAQAILSVLWFSWRGWHQRNAELLTQMVLATLLTAAIFWRYPTLGPCAGVPAFDDVYVSDLQGLRHGTLPAIDLMILKGVIAFPSFHSVLAVLFAYAHRGSSSFIPFAIFNAVMLGSVPSEGGHYLTDLFGGVAVAVLAILATRWWPARIPVWSPVARVEVNAR